MQLTWELISLLGGTQVILAALIGFLGRVWITRIADNHKHDLELARGRDLETLKNELADKHSKEFEVLKSELLDARSVIELERERVSKYLSDLMSANANLNIVTRLSEKRYWVFTQQIEDLEQKFTEARYQLYPNLIMLVSLKVLSKESSDAFESAIYKIAHAWDGYIEALGEYLAYKDNENLSASQYEKLTKAGAKLHEGIFQYEKATFKFLESISIPSSTAFEKS